MRFCITKWFEADVVIKHRVAQCRRAGVGIPLSDKYIIEQLRMTHCCTEQINRIKVYPRCVGIHRIVEDPYPIGTGPATHIHLDGRIYASIAGLSGWVGCVLLKVAIYKNRTDTC